MNVTLLLCGTVVASRNLLLEVPLAINLRALQYSVINTLLPKHIDLISYVFGKPDGEENQ